jgi:hypothetical protein
MESTKGLEDLKALWASAVQGIVSAHTHALGSQLGVVRCVSGNPLSHLALFVSHDAVP